MVEQNRLLTACCHVIMILGAALVCIPLWYSFIGASLTMEQITSGDFPSLPKGHFIENASAAWERGAFSKTYLNSIIVTLGIVIGKITMSMLAAFAITYFRFPFRITCFWLIFMSMMLPVEVRIIPTYESVADVMGPVRALMQWLHLDGIYQSLTGSSIEIDLNWSMVNSYPGLILPIIASASATFLFRQFFLTVPDEICEAARLDNAGPIKFFFTVLLPLSKSNIAALSIILFLYGWNQYLWPLLFTNGPDRATAIIALKGLIPGPQEPPLWNHAMAGALLVLLPPALIILFMQKYFHKGLVDSSK